MRSSTDSVNHNDYFFSRFYASTFSGENNYDIFDYEEKILLTIRIFGSTLIK